MRSADYSKQRANHLPFATPPPPQSQKPALEKDYHENLFVHCAKKETEAVIIFSANAPIYRNQIEDTC